MKIVERMTFNQCIMRYTYLELKQGDFYKSPRRGVTINNTVQAMYGVTTEWEQHRTLRSAVIVKMYPNCVS